MEKDNWIHRSDGMKCRSCMAFVEKTTKKRTSKKIGRCRMKAPTIKGFPVVFDDDWCLEHKIDEEKWADEYPMESKQGMDIPGYSQI